MQNQVLELSASYAVFIGFTSRAGSDKLDYRSTPMRVNSLSDFEKVFGGAPEFENLAVEMDLEGNVREVKMRFCLHASLQLYFQNGGGGVGVLTAGTFADAMADGHGCLERAIAILENDRMENLVAIPDAHWGNRAALVGKSLEVLAKRSTILFCWDGMVGDVLPEIPSGLCDAGAVFGPWAEASFTVPKDSRQWWFAPELLKNPDVAEMQAAIQDWREKANDLAAVADGRWVVSLVGLQDFALIRKIEDWLEGHGPKVPISGAVVGLLVRSDRQVGTWHSAAGKTVEGIRQPADSVAGMNGLVRVGSEVLLRSFLAWGGEGQQQWLQLSRLRRTVIDNCAYYLNQFAGQPNVIEVWQMAANSAAAVLNELWIRGAFKGQTSPEAWGINIGIGSTMTEEEARDGMMRVQISISMIQPNEFEQLNIEVAMQPWP